MATKTSPADVLKALEIRPEVRIQSMLHGGWSTVARVANELTRNHGKPVSEKEVRAEIKRLKRAPPPNARLCSIGGGVREVFRLFDTGDGRDETLRIFDGSEDAPEFVRIVARLTDQLAELRRLCRGHVNCPAERVRTIANEIERIAAKLVE